MDPDCRRSAAEGGLTPRVLTRLRVGGRIQPLVLRLPSLVLLELIRSSLFFLLLLEKRFATQQADVGISGPLGPIPAALHVSNQGFHGITCRWKKSTRRNVERTRRNGSIYSLYVHRSIIISSFPHLAETIICTPSSTRFVNLCLRESCNNADMKKVQ